MSHGLRTQPTRHHNLPLTWVLCALETSRMNWDAVGAIAEILGAAAVLATLIYLALQIRKAEVAANAQALESAQLVNVEFTKMLVDNAATVAKANAGEELTPAEEVAFTNIVHFRTYQAIVSYRRAQALGQPEQILVRNFVVFLLRNPAAKEWWLASEENRPEERKGFSAAWKEQVLISLKERSNGA